MSAAGDAFARVAADLKVAEATLASELSRLEAWRALRQLEERETRGDGLDAIDAESLKASLHATLDRQAPQWRALPPLRDAIARLATGAALEPSRVGSAQSHDPSKPEAHAKVRVKIKASSLTMSSSNLPATSNDASVAPEPKPANPRPVDPAVTPLVERSVAPASVHHPSPASEGRHPELGRIRSIDRALQVPARPPLSASSVSPAAHDRFGRRLPWSALGEPPPAPDDIARPLSGPERSTSRTPQHPSGDATPEPAPPETSMPLVDPSAPRQVRGFAASVAASLPAPTLAPETARKATTVEPAASDAVTDIVTGPSVEPTVADPRVSTLESSLDALVGHPARQSQLRIPVEPHVEEIDVDEAEVEIVRERPLQNTDGIQPHTPPAPPVALSIRLKEPERMTEFDAAGYEAYRTDIEEAEVEIVRQDGGNAADRSGREPEAAPRAPHRFPKAPTGE